MTDPRVLVVIPCYRYAHVLRDAVESVVAQTYANLECTIVDPESPDDTAAVARLLIDSYPERDIRLLQQRDRGLPESRNEAIETSRAELVLPLDADDILAPHAVARLVAEFARDPLIAVAHSHGREFGDSERLLETLPVDAPVMFRRNPLNYCSMFARDVWATVGGYSAEMREGYEDWDFWISVLERGGRFALVPEVLFWYRKDGESMLDGSDRRRLTLRARIALNHPQQFDDDELETALRIVQVGYEEPPPTLRLRIVRWLLALGVADEAVSHCDALLSWDGLPDDPGITGMLHYVAGLGALTNGEPMQAAKFLRTAVHGDPTRAEYKRKLAVAFARCGSRAAALEQLDDAIELEPDSAEAADLLASLGGER